MRPDWREARIKCVLPNNSKCEIKLIRLTVTETTEVEIAMYQESRR